jgi:hypothetical protein
MNRHGLAKQSLRAALLLGAASLGGCGSSLSDFIGPRVLDPCNGTWPACNTIVGCYLGPESYAQGALPLSSAFLVKVPEPSTVVLSFLLTNPTAAGSQTVLTFNEGGCRAQVQYQIPGEEFLAESQAQSQFVRQADLADLGDHLIQFDSDARAQYAVKVDIVSKRSN